MEFTDRQLCLLSDGLIRLMEDAHKAAILCRDKDVKSAIEFYCAELRALNTSICNYMEG